MSEIRLIDANALRAKVCGWFHRDPQEADDRDDCAAALCMAIDEAPTVAAVEVVRCRDCCLGKPFKGRLMCHWNADKNGWGACGTNPDHYCARGKRKEAAHG